MPTSLITQFSRVLAQPLETNSIFTSYTNAKNYAATNKTAYAGQVIRVVDQDGVTVFVITKQKELQRVGNYYGEFKIGASPQIIIHNLGRFPEVLCIDAEGNKCEISVSYQNANQVTVSWQGEVSGKFYLV